MNALLKLNRKGQGLTEYMILVFLVAFVSIGAVKTMGTRIRGRLKDINKKITQDAMKSRTNAPASAPGDEGEDDGGTI